MRDLSHALRSPVNKDQKARDLQPLRQLFMKSAVAARSLPKGHCLTQGDLAFRKPGDGIPAWDAGELIGRTLECAVTANHFFCESDLAAVPGTK